MTTSTRPGDVLAGRYRLIDLLTESAGGRFWRAHDNVLERFVALHVIPEDDPRAPLLLAAARESATVLDARILRVLDAEMRDGRCFVVNEWGTGTSLDILVTHGGPLGPRRAAWLTAEVAGAIAAAHARGVAHGRLNPENVLIDGLGAVRLIGLCVDAALHGVPAGRLDQDRQDLGGILYCALTATWPGPSDSIVPGAPHEHDAVLSPRQVRAGVPRPLDLLWNDITEAGHPKRRWTTHHEADVSTASAVCQRLMEFLGDPTGLPEALAASIPPINEIRRVVLPQVPEMTVRDFERPAPPVDDPPAPVSPWSRRSRRSPTSSTCRPRRGCRSSATLTTATTRWPGCAPGVRRRHPRRRSRSRPSARSSRPSRPRGLPRGGPAPPYPSRRQLRRATARSQPPASGRGTRAPEVRATLTAQTRRPRTTPSPAATGCGWPWSSRPVSPWWSGWRWRSTSAVAGRRWAPNAPSRPSRRR